MNRTVCRWGILGTAEIARKNWQAIRNAPNGSLTAVASRDLQRCRHFIDECQPHAPFDPPPRAFGNYEELLADEGVDAVYIPLPTGIRTPWVIRAAEAGKHVLVEKPVAATAREVREILAACKRNGVQFMDGVMFMHSRRLDSIREVLADGQSVGMVRRITSHFADGEAAGESFANNIRARGELEPLGCLGDLGWYNIRFALWAMNGQLPGQVRGNLLAEYRHPNSALSVPAEFSGELFYADGVSANFFCSFLAGIEQWANLSGTHGALRIADFVLPRRGDELEFEVSNLAFTIKGCDFIMEDHAQRLVVRECSHSDANAQESNMFRCFSNLALSGRIDDSWGEMVLKTQQVLDACLESARQGGSLINLS
jgi:predicted dehydrogenase